tara:strand:- start:302 stop:598 length:297 start_codon:yes stop_codon:yes gene_type:complete
VGGITLPELNLVTSVFPVEPASASADAFSSGKLRLLKLVDSSEQDDDDDDDVDDKEDVNVALSTALFPCGGISGKASFTASPLLLSSSPPFADPPSSL